MLLCCPLSQAASPKQPHTSSKLTVLPRYQHRESLQEWFRNTLPSCKQACVRVLPCISPSSVLNTGCSSHCTWGRVSNQAGSTQRLYPASGGLVSQLDTGAQLFSLCSLLAQLAQPFSLCLLLCHFPSLAAWSLITSVCKKGVTKSSSSGLRR